MSISKGCHKGFEHSTRPHESHRGRRRSGLQGWLLHAKRQDGASPALLESHDCGLPRGELCGIQMPDLRQRDVGDLRPGLRQRLRQGQHKHLATLLLYAEP